MKTWSWDSFKEIPAVTVTTGLVDTALGDASASTKDVTKKSSLTTENLKDRDGNEKKGEIKINVKETKKSPDFGTGKNKNSKDSG